MGICLYAIVERQVDRDDMIGRGVHWEEVAAVKFNKYYSFMYALHEDRPLFSIEQGDGVQKGWPDDASLDHYARERRCIENGLQWCDLRTLVRIVESGPIDEEDNNGPFLGQPAAVVAFMRSFEREGIRTRVLFYEL